MSAPNLKLPTTITGFTTGITLGSAAVTNLVGIVTNDASSNKVIKVNSIFCSNISNVDAKISVAINNVGVGITYHLAKDIPVLTQTTQIISSKDSYFYLEENVKLQAQVSIADKMDIVVGYEEIS
tara:strand:+ start:387 stop:761 length:375 start_codon:yes stop_codon:yes gene_type:complete